MKTRLVKSEDTDVILINPEGEIIYDDIGNYRYFSLGMDSAVGKNIRELFKNLGEDYPLLQAANQGIAIKNFEWELTTERNIQLKKRGSAYPLYDGEEVVGAIEFAHFFYSKNYISEIEQHADHLLYRHNHTKYVLDDIITANPVMEQMKENITRIALSDSNVLIYGETGSGKELIAQSIHNSSRRYGKDFVSQNCGAIPATLLESLLFGTTKGSFTGALDKPGLFEIVNGGTIFLDEINSMEPSLQVKLLKAIETKKIRRIGSDKEIRLDFRLVAATNEDPFLLLKQGRMKADLFYRLAVAYLHLPSLSDRSGDIELLANYFIDYFNLKTERSVQHPGRDVLDIFYHYDWPGNVRELRNVIEGFFALGDDDIMKPADIPEYIRESVKNRRTEEICGRNQEGCENLNESLAKLESDIVTGMYRSCGCELTETAVRLGISKQLLRFKLNKYEGGEL